MSSFVRMPLGWVAGIGVDLNLLDAPLRDSLYRLFISGMTALLVVGLGGWWWGKRLVGSTVDLAKMATALGRGEALPRCGQPHYLEAAQVYEAQRAAAVLLKKRQAERDAVAEDLRQTAITLESRVLERTQQLDEAARVAQQANQAKSEFLASMSHELRTPLNAVIGFSQILQMRLSSAPEAEYAGYIRRAGEELHSLIEDVLDLAKIESGQLRVKAEDVQLSSVFDHLRTTLEPVAKLKTIGLYLPRERCDLKVRADGARLMQVFLNFGTNAIKYNLPGGSLAVEVARMDGGWVRVSFIDTGIGIPLERQQEVFEAFNRLGAERSSIEGTGIGLTICRNLVQLMGGRIGFSSAPGVGSKFWVEFPEVERSTTADPDYGNASLHDAYSRTILCIEDNAANIVLMKELLGSQPDTRVLVAPLGLIGIERALDSHPDLIITDIHLPDISGYEVLERLKTVSGLADIPVIAVTAAATPTDIARGTRAGFFRYITKPFNVDDLQNAIDAAFAQAKRIFPKDEKKLGLA